MNNNSVDAEVTKLFRFNKELLFGLFSNNVLSTLVSLGKSPMAPTADDKEWAYYELERTAKEIKNKVHFLLPQDWKEETDVMEVRFEFVIRHYINEMMLPHLLETALVARLTDKWLLERVGYDQNNYAPILAEIRSQALKQASGFTRKSVI